MAEYFQGAELVNQLAKAALGDSAVLEADWSNIKDIGSAIYSSVENVEAATKTLVDQIGETVIANDRAYTAMDAPNIVVNNREYGSVTQKLRIKYPEASDNESYQLNDNQVYEMDQYHAPQVTQHFWDNATTFAIEKPSIPLVQFRDAFLNEGKWMAFEGALRRTWTDQETFLTEQLIKQIQSSRIAQDVASTYSGTDYTGAGGTRVVNLRALYNAQMGSSLTQAQCWTSAEFWRYAFYQIERFARLMRTRKTIFNAEGAVNFTPPEFRRLTILDDVIAASNYYLYNAPNQFLTDKMGLPEFETISAWQGNGTTMDQVSASTVYIKVTLPNGSTKVVNISGVIAQLFDRDAMMLTRYALRGYTHFNKKAEFINPFYKRDVSFLNALDENCITFTIS